MTKTMLAVFLFILSFNTFAWHQRYGVIERMYVDPDKVVFTLKDGNGDFVRGQCGSTLFDMPRSNANFKEFFSMMLIAAAAKKQVVFDINQCNPSDGARDLISHGSVAFYY